MGIHATTRYGECSLSADLGQGDTIIALRADMDGLLVAEESGLPFASCIPGNMHACGHDTHMAILLATAKYLKEHEAELPCRIRLIFQPNEEGAQSGARMMVENGVDLLSNSGGNPYHIYPQVTRPFDQSSYGIPTPSEHPLESMERLFGFTRDIQQAAGDIPVVGNGYTWLRQFAPNAGSANLAAGNCSFMGLGRSSFAYPDAPHDLMATGKMQPNKCCITCSKCTQIMRDHGRTGCVIRNAGIYGPLYQQYRAEADARAAAAAR
jgi:2,4-dienoyl-CoA reductase-like NADH-dependent reductase (Old Yellow Enzyme family)